MDLAKVFCFWSVLSIVEKMTAFAAKGSLTYCNAPRVTTGDSATVACHFNVDLNQEKRDFVIQHHNQLGEFSEVLACYWLTHNSLKCDPEPEYTFDGRIGRTIILGIPSAGQQHVGTYRCLVLPADLTESIPCSFHVKVNSESTTELPERTRNTTESVQRDNIVPVFAIAIPVVLSSLCVLIMIIICRKRRPALLRKTSNRNEERISPRRGDDSYVEKQSLVSPSATENKELTRKEISGTYCKYICNRTVQLVEETGVVVITGPGRCGKSALGRNVNDHFQEKGLSPLVLDNPHQWWTKKQADRKHIVFLDECHLDGSSMKALRSMWDDQCHIIFSIRSDVINSKKCVRVFPPFLKTASSVNLSKSRISYIEGSKQLRQACLEGNVEKVETLLCVGADPNVTDKDSKTPLHIACKKGNPDIVHLLWAGSSVDTWDTPGLTPLQYACISSSEQTTRFTGTTMQDREDISKTAQPDVDDEGDLFPRHDGSLREKIAKTLIAYGANIKVTDKTKGRTPLHIACEYENNGLVKLLLNAGASVDAKDKNGCTPLHLACVGGNEQIVQMLIDNGADTDVKAKNGDTPTSLALRNGQAHIVNMLKVKESTV